MQAKKPNYSTARPAEQNEQQMYSTGYHFPT
jgi:hypothetical protein